MTLLLHDRPARTELAPGPTGPGTPVVLARDVHADVRQELCNAGMEPVWVLPRIDARFSVPLAVTGSDLAAALASAPLARVAYVVSPNLVGIHADLRLLERVADLHRVRLVVDDRWSGHAAARAAARTARSMLTRIPGVHVLTAADLALPVDRVALDRLVVDVRGRGVRAAVLAARLRSETDLEAGALDAFRVLLTIPPGTGPATIRAMVLTVVATGSWCGPARRRGPDPLAQLPTPGPPRLSARAVAARPHERVPLRDAVGRVCAESIVVGPPGVPIVLPGEVVDRETVAWLLEACACDARVEALDPTLSTVQVTTAGSGPVVDLRQPARRRR